MVRDIIPLNELPKWAYLDSEWKEIELKTIAIVDGNRMVYDNEKYKKQLAESKCKIRKLIF